MTYPPHPKHRAHCTALLSVSFPDNLAGLSFVEQLIFSEYLLYITAYTISGKPVSRSTSFVVTKTDNTFDFSWTDLQMTSTILATLAIIVFSIINFKD